MIPPLLVVYWWSQGRCRRCTCARPGWSPLVVGLGGTADRQLGARLPGLQHEDWRYPMLRERAGRAEVGRRPARHPPDPHAAGLPRHAAGLRRRRRRPGTGAGLARPRRVRWSAWPRSRWSSSPTGRCTAFVATARPGAVMDRGLWGWSRHPNYFGEIGFWFALALFGVAAAPDEAWWLFAGTLRDAGDVPRRQHPDDGAAQPGTPAALPGGRRPGAGAGAAAAAGPHAGRREPAPGCSWPGLGDTGAAHRDPPRPARRRGRDRGPSPGWSAARSSALRLARPQDWARDYWSRSHRYRGLDRVRTVHGTADRPRPPTHRVLRVRRADGLADSPSTTTPWWSPPA